MAYNSWFWGMGNTRARAQQHRAATKSAWSERSRVQIDGQDGPDEWYDTSEDEGIPIKYGFANNDGSSLGPEEKARLLSRMPALFSTDLPPCSPHMQVAYEKVVARLRNHWLSHRGETSISDVCLLVKSELDKQRDGPRGQRPPFPVSHTYTIFTYELRWIDYFIREAQTPEPMTESELNNRAKESPIPNVLGISCHREDVLNLWTAWHEKKRSMMDLEDLNEDLDSGTASTSSELTVLDYNDMED